MASRQIVIARFNEDVKWAQGLPAVVYNKGAPLVTPLPQRPLPNVGRESHTYLHHIITYWDVLADITLFTQGRIDDHLPPGIPIENLFKNNSDVVIPRVMRTRDWGIDGRLEFKPGVHADAFNSGRMKRAELSLVDWYRNYLSLDPEIMGSLIFAPGAIFAASKRCIQRRPKEFYTRLLSCFDHHEDPEEGHYMERAWLYVLGMGITEVHVPPSG